MGTRASDTLGRMTDRPPIELLLGDVVRLRRSHPCGGDEWQVDRLGADIGLRCLLCDRHVLIDRRSLERRIAAFVTRGDPAISAAVAPRAKDAGVDAAAPLEPGDQSETDARGVAAP
jgi:hypothetical protein